MGAGEGSLRGLGLKGEGDAGERGGMMEGLVMFFLQLYIFFTALRLCPLTIMHHHDTTSHNNPRDERRRPRVLRRRAGGGPLAAGRVGGAGPDARGGAAAAAGEWLGASILFRCSVMFIYVSRIYTPR